MTPEEFAAKLEELRLAIADRLSMSWSFRLRH
jgi:hypothetical protein